MYLNYQGILWKMVNALIEGIEMKIEAELVEFWCAEMHNKDMCMGQYYAEDDWSRKVYARSAEELHEKILWSMSDID